MKIDRNSCEKIGKCLFMCRDTLESGTLHFFARPECFVLTAENRVTPVPMKQTSALKTCQNFLGEKNFEVGGVVETQ